MLKKNITAQEVCDLLNETLKLDYDCIHTLFAHRVECNNEVANHPTIQVQQIDKTNRLGILGLLNGMFGINENGMGVICMQIEDTKILGFKIVK